MFIPLFFKNFVVVNIYPLPSSQTVISFKKGEVDNGAAPAFQFSVLCQLCYFLSPFSPLFGIFFTLKKGEVDNVPPPIAAPGYQFPILPTLLLFQRGAGGGQFSYLFFYIDKKRIKI